MIFNHEKRQNGRDHQHGYGGEVDFGRLRLMCEQFHTGCRRYFGYGHFDECPAYHHEK